MRTTKDFSNALTYLIGSGIIWCIGTVGAATAIATLLSLAALPFFKVFWTVIGFTVLGTGALFLILFVLGGIIGKSSMIFIKTFRCKHCGTLDAAHTISGADIKCAYCGKSQNPEKHIYIKGDINDRL